MPPDQDQDDGDGKVHPLRANHVVAEVGGLPDECSVSLCLYGEDLRPNEVTALLGVEPTDSFERGYRRKPHSRPMHHGGWFFQARGQPPQGPDDLARSVLTRFSVPPETWAAARQRYKVELRVGVHVAAGWNKGFSLTPTTLNLIAMTGAEVGFDLYFEDALEE
jgi:hypothetical protein